jgi:hypothetical protein
MLSRQHGFMGFLIGTILDQWDLRGRSIMELL